MNTILKTLSRPVVAGLGAVALYAATLMFPSHASAADAPWTNTFNMGTISATSSTFNKWDPKAGGSFGASFVFKNNEIGVLNASGLGQAGYMNYTRKSPERYSYSNANLFQNNYTFALDKASSFALNIGLGIDTAVIAAFEGPLAISLSSKTGYTWNGTITGASWEKIWGNLEAGDYTLSISGKYGADGRGAESFIQGYSATFLAGEAQPGDVPLPAALVLLGTALAGAGVYGRRKATAARAA
ncbi:VPLPA-CTERM sorting domain-containing protein [Phaeovibrio sulfidiphilus]|uniref:VPLPA-CTERM sorting domain-containing protein n=1 Tax=Phaeovibrio sulfidiphilus TaxID=1220600 RepID=A0A8J7CWM9_9PROT|nr:VPLPA-CTERM sorting domain-containing protein [Phaeovibrio sulfidiphilus]MBE1237696.1 VPLPA-CTERM sorting domain-containing protein [Phaeovibrio sulfidiphilus]